MGTKLTLQSGRKYIFGSILIIWIVLILTIAFWDFYQTDKSIYNLALIEAKAAFQKDLAYRRWASLHGGVYIKPTSDTPPNKYLKVPDRDIETKDGKKLTLINPAYMTRKVHELSDSTYKVKGHITSLNPIRPENKADEWETAALKMFEKGVKENHQLVTFRNQTHLRYIHSMVTEKSCLKCHAGQGYKVGDIRGGISVSIPFRDYETLASQHNKEMGLIYSFIGLFGGVGLVFASKKLKRYENILFTNQQNLSVTLHSIGDAVIVTDAAGRITMMNPVAENLTGWDFDDAKSVNLETVLVLYDEVTGVKLESPLDKILKTQKIVDLSNQTILKSKKGNEYNISNTAAPIKKEDGEIIGAVLVFSDVTEKYKKNRELERIRLTNIKIIEDLQNEIEQKNKTSKALSESEERLRLSLDASGQGLFDLNIKTGEEIFSDQYAEMLGFEPNNFTETRSTFFERMHPEDLQRVQLSYQDYVNGKSQEYRVEFRQKTADGSWKWILSTGKITEYSKDKKPIRMLGTHTDIDLIKNLQEEKHKLLLQLYQTQKMESVGRLAGGVAHDFNNLLGVILGHCELAGMKLAPEDPVSKHLEEIQNAGEKSAQLTRQLLAFARKQTILPKVLNLNDLIENMHKLLQRLIGENIELEWNPGLNIWKVSMDPTQLDQILVNMCVNSRDAISGAGKITLHTENCVVDESYAAWNPELLPGEYVKLEITDNGCGMDKETQLNIFEPFFTTKEIGKGSGLGLSTVYGIIKQNNGYIKLYSEPGNGTTFKIFLPRCEKEETQSSKDKITHESLKGNQTILLVEDDIALLDLEKIMIESFGYNVYAVSSPADAIRFIETGENKVDLLMTDVIMPEMNGKELYKKIAGIEPGIKCLFISGYTADNISKHGVLDEDAGFIQKPFSIFQLGIKIKELFA